MTVAGSDHVAGLLAYCKLVVRRELCLKVQWPTSNELALLIGAGIRARPFQEPGSGVLEYYYVRGTGPLRARLNTELDPLALFQIAEAFALDR